MLSLGVELPLAPEEEGSLGVAVSEYTAGVADVGRLFEIIPVLVR